MKGAAYEPILAPFFRYCLTHTHEVKMATILGGSYALFIAFNPANYTLFYEKYRIFSC